MWRDGHCEVRVNYHSAGGTACMHTHTHTHQANQCRWSPCTHREVNDILLAPSGVTGEIPHGVG